MTALREKLPVGAASIWGRWMPALLVAVACVAIFVLPSSLSYYNAQLVAVAMLYGVVALSMDVAWGYTGILSMGQAVFFGLGNYGVALVSVHVSSTGIVSSVNTGWWVWPVGALAGIVVAMGVALAVGTFAFSGRGATDFYVAVVTLALSVLVSTAFLQTARLGGQNGLSNYAIYSISPQGWFWISGGCLVAIGLAARALVRSDCGLLLRAVRDNEQRASYFGFKVPKVKLGVFVGAAGVSAFAGALYGGYIGFVSPPLLGFLAATDIIVWTAVGGRATLIGPIVGALVINVAGPHISASFPELWTMLLGALFIVVVTLIPDGLYPSLVRGLGRLRGSVRRRDGEPTTSSRRLRIREQAPPGRARTAGGGSLEIADVHRSFGGLNVLRGVSLRVDEGELVCIVGPNGAGKTTLLNVLSDGRVPHDGTVELSIDGMHKLDGMAVPKIVGCGVGRKFQAPNLFESLSVGEVLLLAVRRGSVPSVWRRSREIPLTPPVVRILEATQLADHLDARVGDLSHGQRQALEVAATVALNSTVLLLDEPTAGLTSHERALIGTLLRTLVDEHGLTILMIEHDFEFVRQIADKLAVLHDGRVLAVGSVNEVADSALVRDAYLGVAE